ncbi:hypothetical protein JCM10908_005861 [Rhodotorula pacifica]|uniref:Zim17p n=1 Tax=Rhodotorula pacifica TaxID=1495444 RepID=UPI003172239B
MQASVRSLLRSTHAAPPRLAPRPRLASPRLGAVIWSSARPFSFSTPTHDQQQPTRVPVNAAQGTPIGKVVDRRLRIVFTCTAPASQETPDQPCGHRSSHEFSRQSYEKGVVIVQCPECSNRHLIADHLHWFSQTPSPAHPTGQALGAEQPRTIEQLMREKGEQVRWATTTSDETGVEGVDADGRQQIKMVMRERTEEDGGKTVEVVPESEVAQQ